MSGVPDRVRATILVLDGLGVGAMHDVEETRPQDRGANTLVHTAERVGGLRLPTLERIGLGNVAPAPFLLHVGTAALASYGACRLRYAGADTYMGHQEIMGSLLAPPRKQLMREVGPAVREALERHGHHVEPLSDDTTCLVVDGRAVVHDNMEAEPGMNVNVTANLDELPLDALSAICDTVRGAVDVARVILVGGHGFSLDDVRRHLKRAPGGAVGVDTPALGIYGTNPEIRHLGKGARVELQVASLVQRSGRPVVLIGKAADVVECPASTRLPMGDTQGVFDLLHEHLASMDEGLIVANVQETDVAGHEQDPHRMARTLEIVDRELDRLLRSSRPADALLITADHGNDPTMGHSGHTRELVPFLFHSPRYAATSLGVRSSLADVGATVAALFAVGPTEIGTSILDEITPRAAG